MKALFIKDLRYLAKQKTFLLIIIAISLLLAITQTDNNLFVVTYLTFMGSFLGLGTITSDEQAGGMAFLFTLPIARRTYVQEKYLLCLGVGLCALLTGILCCLLVKPFVETAAPADEILLTAAASILILLVLIALMLPPQLKFGAERARLAIFIGLGGFFALIMLTGGIISVAGPALLSHRFTSLGSGAVLALIMLIASYRASLRIILRREY